MASHPLRILVVEDEGILRLDLECMLVDLGHQIAGSAANLPDGLHLAATLGVDLGILDLNLGGTQSRDIADRLAERGIPFLFASGYSPSSIPSSHAGRPCISKPFSSRDLSEAIAVALAPSPEVSDRPVQ